MVIDAKSSRRRQQPLRRGQSCSQVDLACVRCLFYILAYVCAHTHTRVYKCVCVSVRVCARASDDSKTRLRLIRYRRRNISTRRSWGARVWRTHHSFPKLRTNFPSNFRNLNDLKRTYTRVHFILFILGLNRESGWPLALLPSGCHYKPNLIYAYNCFTL